MDEFMERYRRACAQLNMDYRLVNTAQPMDTFVRAYLEDRKRVR